MATREKRYSKILNEHFTIYKDCVVFDSGVRYTNHEMRQMADQDDDTKLSVHLIKEMFDGEIQ